MKYFVSLFALVAVLALTLAACDSGVAPDPTGPERAAGDDFAFSKDHKTLVCHVATDEDDAGNIDLIEVPNVAKHLDNPDHCYDGVCDYLPGDQGASGVGDEDTDGDGIDEGCEIPVEEPACPCWDDPAELIAAEPGISTPICGLNAPDHRFVFGGNEEGSYNFNVVRNDIAGSYCNWDSTIQGNTSYPISSEQFDACYADLAPYCVQG